EELLYTIEARAGDVIFVSPGTIHAIGAGIVLYELQEYSDVTYRLYDYGRLQADGRPRELHVAQALEVLNFAPSTRMRLAPLSVIPEGDRHGLASHRVLAVCRYFVLEELQLRSTHRAAVAASSCQILCVLSGACLLRTAQAELPLTLGDTVVLPA